MNSCVYQREREEMRVSPLATLWKRPVTVLTPAQHSVGLYSSSVRLYGKRVSRGRRPARIVCKTRKAHKAFHRGAWASGLWDSDEEVGVPLGACARRSAVESYVMTNGNLNFHLFSGTLLRDKVFADLIKAK